jgi:hypothetical protein
MVRFAGAPDDALVHINDRYVGKLGRLEQQGIVLEPGPYRITVEATGYFPHDQLVTVQDLEIEAPKVVVELEEIPD